MSALSDALSMLARDARRIAVSADGGVTLLSATLVLESQLHTGDHPASPPEPPRIAGTCPECRHLALVTACSRAGCGGRVAICWGCPDVAEEFTASGGLCPVCRSPEVTEGSTSRDEGECLWAEVERVAPTRWRVRPVRSETPAEQREKAAKPKRAKAPKAGAS